MVDPVGSENIDPMQMYKSECQRGADLFKRSLDRYAQEKDVRKRYEFEKVIKDSLKVMNEACRGLKKQEALKQEQKLEKDFKTYQEDPSSDRLAELHKEADQIKDSI